MVNVRVVNAFVPHQGDGLLKRIYGCFNRQLYRIPYLIYIDYLHFCVH